MTASKNNRKREIRAQESEVRAILNEWAPIGCPTPADEYDCLVHKVVSLLQQPCTEAEVEALLVDELKNHFGMDAPGDTALVVARLFSRA